MASKRYTSDLEKLWGPYLDKAAARYPRLSDPLARAVALQQLFAESGGDPNAVGASGEQGGYQFMPATWQAYGKGNPFGMQETVDARYRFVNDLFNRYGGDYAKILQAYNAGEDDVNKGTVPTSARAYAQNILAAINDASGTGALRGSSLPMGASATAAPGGRSVADALKERLWGPLMSLFQGETAAASPVQTTAAQPPMQPVMGGQQVQGPPAPTDRNASALRRGPGFGTLATSMSAPGPTTPRQPSLAEQIMSLLSTEEILKDVSKMGGKKYDRVPDAEAFSGQQAAMADQLLQAFNEYNAPERQNKILSIAEPALTGLAFLLDAFSKDEERANAAVGKVEDIARTKEARAKAKSEQKRTKLMDTIAALTNVSDMRRLGYGAVADAKGDENTTWRSLFGAAADMAGDRATALTYGAQSGEGAASGNAYHQRIWELYKEGHNEARKTFGDDFSAPDPANPNAPWDKAHVYAIQYVSAMTGIPLSDITKVVGDKTKVPEPPTNEGISLFKSGVSGPFPGAQIGGAYGYNRSLRK